MKVIGNGGFALQTAPTKKHRNATQKNRKNGGYYDTPHWVTCDVRQEI